MWAGLAQSLRQPSSPSSTITRPSPTPITDWKTYTNRAFGFEVKYPPFTELVVNDKQSQNDIDFIPKNYISSGRYESPRLRLMVYETDQPIADANLPRSFGDEALEGGQSLYFVAGPRKQLVASCGTYGDRNVLLMCNQIIMTLRFTR